MDEESDLDAFGEDEPHEGVAKWAVASVRADAAGPGATGDSEEWYVNSQDPWLLRGEPCTLTCLQTGDGQHLRFQVLKKSGDLVMVTCTKHQFQEVCDEQVGLSGPLRTKAAIHQILKEGLEEFPHDPPQRDCATLGDEDDLDDFGEDDADQIVGQLAREKSSAIRMASVDEHGWYMESQNPYTFAGETCMLLSYASHDEEQLKFELLKASLDKVTVVIRRQKFEELCSQQTGDSEPARVQAAIRQLFKEGLDDFPASASRKTSTTSGAGRDCSSRLKAVLKSWNRCDNGLVAAVDMKALLYRLHPSCPDQVLEQLLFLSSKGDGLVSVDSLIDTLSGVSA